MLSELFTLAMEKRFRICYNQNGDVARIGIPACLQLATRMLEERLLRLWFVRSAGYRYCDNIYCPFYSSPGVFDD